MEKFRVDFRPDAREEVYAAAEYLLDHGGITIAERWLVGLKSAVDSLATMPRRCPRIREQDKFPDLEMRQLLYGEYRIIFSISGNNVTVLYVRHVKQDELREL